jgi:cytochrome P450
MPLLDPKPKPRPYLLSRIRSVENLPVYRAGFPIIGTTRSFKNDPFEFHIKAFRTCGPIYRTRLGIKDWVVLAGLEANDLVWRNTDLWNYGEANAAFGEQMGPDHVTQLDGERHKKRRAHLKPAFRMESIVRHANSLAHFLEEIYEAPFEFKPGRFLEQKSYPAKANGFFGGGTHICLGMNLAMIHAPLILANLVRNYHFKFAFDPSLAVRMTIGTNQVRKNVPLTLTRKGASSAAAGPMEDTSDVA